MKYEKVTEAKFIERLNRFVARVELPDGEECRVHVKNTGRCKELLLPGAKVYLEDFDGRMGTRRMRYSLVAVEKVLDTAKTGSDQDGGVLTRTSQDASVLLLNMDSQAPNKVVHEALLDGTIVLPGLADELTKIKPETTFRSGADSAGQSRFDFYVETAAHRAFIEVKGVTLEEDGHARFPDAPTERGVKHINELIRARQEGYGAYIIFVVQMEGAKDVSPNYDTHPAFGEALAKAKRAGVEILAYDCKVTPDSLRINKPIPVTLHGAHNQ